MKHTSDASLINLIEKNYRNLSKYSNTSANFKQRLRARRSKMGRTQSCGQIEEGTRIDFEVEHQKKFLKQDAVKKRNNILANDSHVIEPNELHRRMPVPHTKISPTFILAAK